MSLSIPRFRSFFFIGSSLKVLIADHIQVLIISQGASD